MTEYGAWVTGGLRFTASGVAWLTFDPDDARIVNWSASQGFFDDTELSASFGSAVYQPVELDGLDQPIVLTDEAIFHRVAGLWQESDYESSEMSYYDLAVDNSGDPRIGARHSSGLELIHTDSEGFWQYSEAEASIDGNQFGVAVDTADNTHA